MLRLRENADVCLAHLSSEISVQFLQSSGAVELFIVKVSVCRRGMRVVKGFSISDRPKRA